jgi:uncharacterized protein (TIGR02466 family)
MQVERRDVFPTRLWIFDIPELLEQHAAWIKRILSRRVSEPQTAGRSNRKGWNSAKTVFDEPEFNPLKAAANTAFAHAFGDMQLSNNLTFSLQAWINLHDPGGFNTLHSHPNVLLSGTYYLQVPDGAGPLVFRDPRPGVVLVSFDGNGVHCRELEVLQPKVGQLIVFANWLEHRVEPNEGCEPRISIAMNAIMA